MIVDATQRWRAGRAAYRPAGEPIATRLYEVAAIDSDCIARSFVEGHHYAGSYSPARFRFALRRGLSLVGVAIFSVPMRPECTFAELPDIETSVELSRFVLLDDVPANGETWFLGRAFELLRGEGLTGVASFSDPERRTTLDGHVIMPGHVGTIYQAHNAVYRGKNGPQTLYLLPDGKVVSPRALSKIRSKGGPRQERGGHATIEALERAGADAFDASDPRGWLRRALAQTCRRFRHHGNHKYLWALNRRDRRHLPESLDYPKLRCAP